jgi:hypothetical protein
MFTDSDQLLPDGVDNRRRSSNTQPSVQPLCAAQTLGGVSDNINLDVGDIDSRGPALVRGRRAFKRSVFAGQLSENPIS